MPALPLRNMLRSEFGIFIFRQFFCQVAARACLGSCNRCRIQRNPSYFSFGNYLMKFYLGHTDIPANVDRCG